MFGEKIASMKPTETKWITNRPKIDKPDYIQFLNHAPGNILLKLEFSPDGKYFYLTNQDETYLQFKRNDSAKIDHLTKSRTQCFMSGEIYEIYLNYADPRTKEAKTQILIIEFKDAKAVNIYLR